MTNIASALKAEISRVSRKEIRADTQSLKKSSSAYRSEIAELKRRMRSMEQTLHRLSKNVAKSAPVESSASAGPLRFSAKGLSSQRKRLGLSADACGKLVGASSQSVYNWEAGKARPRASLLPAIAALRKMSKKEVAARLEALGTTGGADTGS